MKLECDVLVVGAGVAGVPAALAASRSGADTILVEAGASPGGAGVEGLHRHICGLYLNGPESTVDFLNSGLVAEICGLLGDAKPVRMGRVDVLPYDHDRLRDVFTSLPGKERLLRVMYGSPASRVEFSGDRIASVVAGEATIVPQTVVDCSGHGVVIRSSEMLYDVAGEDQLQLAGCNVLFGGLSGVDETLSIRLPFVLRQAKEAGKLPSGMQFAMFAPGDRVSEGWCKMSLPAFAQRGGRSVEACVRLIHECLKGSLPAFENSVILKASPELGREGARLRGEYSLTAYDVLSARKFDDAVVRNAWPIEMWDPVRGPNYRYPPTGDYYEIPARCLKSASVKNLLCAGRCISVSHDALGSTRVMGTCMALGESAGRLALSLK